MLHVFARGDYNIAQAIVSMSAFSQNKPAQLLV